SQYQFIAVSTVGERSNVGLIRLNRPQVLNALSSGLMAEVVQALADFDGNGGIAATVITGEGKAFAAGADIKEMTARSFAGLVTGKFRSNFAALQSTKPLIAAVNGYAFGGGCELAMYADIIIASERAKFGQPEIKIGLIPGAGGTQRLTKAIGKSRTMEMVLTGDSIGAQEAEKCGLVSRVVPAESLLSEAIKTGEAIGRNSKITVAIAKAAVDASLETTLRQGLSTEARLFQTTFATKDRVEGMAAFVEKRAPQFSDE
ncbi:PREDICTED: enoyl-CoA hydratase, mitochondrial-like, partial [Rhagoletis zephyria]|uniref:enoyl-CoA hydratase, mitochondrial-like n=1 Tax=Rhagoletis zephyria TaxID=28612 RepID=UPI0008113CC2